MDLRTALLSLSVRPSGACDILGPFWTIFGRTGFYEALMKGPDLCLVPKMEFWLVLVGAALEGVCKAL